MTKPQLQKLVLLHRARVDAEMAFLSGEIRRPYDTVARYRKAISGTPILDTKWSFRDYETAFVRHLARCRREGVPE